MKKTTKIILGVVAALLVVVVAFIAFSVYYLMQGPDLSKYAHLNEPQISSVPNQKMLVVEAKGDPNVVGAKAFGLLFELYFKMKESSKAPGGAVPRARWPMPLETPKSEWVGLYAMPISESITEVPPHQAPPELKASLTLWEYGEVAEILHHGPYTEEQPTIARLKEFIQAQGYEIIGVHEEEYLKGPTMFSQGNPEKYVTIIRYRVQKAASPL